MKFLEGQEFEHAGIKYRVLGGNRCEGDLVIEFCPLRPGWHRPTISHSLILIEFKAQVEENNYGARGKVKSGAGMFYLHRAIQAACFNGEGWEAVAARILQERRGR